jgi:hypothetical protein
VRTPLYKTVPNKWQACQHDRLEVAFDGLRAARAMSVIPSEAVNPGRPVYEYITLYNVLPVKTVAMPLENPANPLQNKACEALRRQRSGVRISSGAQMLHIATFGDDRHSRGLSKESIRRRARRTLQTCGSRRGLLERAPPYALKHCRNPCRGGAPAPTFLHKYERPPVIDLAGRANFQNK